MGKQDARRVVSVGVVVLAAAAGLGGGLARASSGDAAGWLVHFENVVVAPVERSDTTQIVDAGTIDTDGFSHVVLCIGGEMKSQPTKSGKIGVVLVPDMYPFDKVLETQGRFVFPLEVTATVDVSDNSRLFQSEQLRAAIAFPRYRVYVYNGTDAVAGVWIFAYRTRGSD